LLNVLLGMGLAGVNSVLLHLYYSLKAENSNDDALHLITVFFFASAQLLLLACTTRTQPHRRLLFVAFWLVLGLSTLLLLLIGASYVRYGGF